MARLDVETLQDRKRRRVWDVEAVSRLLRPKRQPREFKSSREILELLEVSRRCGEAKAGTCPRSP